MTHAATSNLLSLGTHAFLTRPVLPAPRKRTLVTFEKKAAKVKDDPPQVSFIPWSKTKLRACVKEFLRHTEGCQRCFWRTWSHRWACDSRLPDLYQLPAGVVGSCSHPTRMHVANGQPPRMPFETLAFQHVPLMEQRRLSVAQLMFLKAISRVFHSPLDKSVLQTCKEKKIKINLWWTLKWVWKLSFYCVPSPIS